ncbi:hypothetical protein NW759_011205 [Fusarium solani]|nr:hypothetical protein NW759_011205 [Fusarium solani]
MKLFFIAIFGLVQAMLAVAAPVHSHANRRGQEDAPSPGIVRRAGPLRRIELDTFVRIRDDEPWPDSDDYFNRDQSPRSYVLGGLGDNTATDDFAVSAGGEIRVHVSTVLRILSDGSLSVHYTLQLYEGSSESTNDLDGTKSGAFVVRPGESRKHEDSVRNTAEDDDDTGTVGWWITNKRG